MPYGMLTPHDDMGDWGQSPEEKEMQDPGLPKTAGTASEARSEVLQEAAGLERLSKEFEKLLTILVDKLTQVLLPDQPPGPSKIEVEPDVQTPLGQNLHSTRYMILFNFSLCMIKINDISADRYRNFRNNRILLASS